uniref:Uncharacterized protein n=1 Tax=Erpetoichthys calabaricus TaxID=27687 RepID=A0A8C4X739_ERPCA
MATTTAQDIKELKNQEKHVNTHFEAAFKSILEKLRKMHLNVKQMFTTRIEIAEQLASTSDGEATAANFECKILGYRLAALEDGCRRNNIRIEGLHENCESLNPVKFVAELFSKIIEEDFKSDTEIAAAYRLRGSNISKPKTISP